MVPMENEMRSKSRTSFTAQVPFWKNFTQVLNTLFKPSGYSKLPLKI